MKNKIFATLLALTLALSLTACGSKSDSSGSADDTPTGVAVQVQPVTADTISTENKVSGKVVKTGKGKKITVMTYKPKKGEKRKMGHRQPYTKVQIEAINA